jgi:hypothetical protein
MGTESTGYDVPVGTYEDAKAMVGTTTPVRFGDIAVNARVEAGRWTADPVAHRPGAAARRHVHQRLQTTPSTSSRSGSATT